MKGLVRRALGAAAGLLAFAGATAFAAPAALPFEPLNASASVSADDMKPLDLLPASDFTASSIESSITLIGGLDFDAGYKLDPSGRTALAGQSSDADGLFLSSVGSPYGNLADGGSYVGLSTHVTPGLRVFAGVADMAPGALSSAPDAYTALRRLGGTPAPYAARSADALVAGIAWQPAAWASFGVTATQAHERNGILANPAPGATANTNAIGVTARVGLGGGWSTSATYGEGESQLDLRSGFNSLTEPGLRTRTYGIAIAKNGLFGDDTLGIAVSQPALAANGEFVTMPGAGGAPLLARNHLLEGIGPKQETDVEIGYVTSFLDGSLSLQTNASFQMNYAGQTGQNAVSLLSRARIKF